MRKKEPDIESSQVAILKDGKDAPFWQTIKKIVEQEKTDLEREIFDNEMITEKERDDLRRWRNFLQYFLLLPEKCIESLEAKTVADGTDAEGDTADPYENLWTPLREKIKTKSG